MSVLVEIAVIRRDEACQPRATTHLDLIEEYANALLDGAAFPPVTLFDDGVDYWLADGYHRLDAAEAAGRAEILADVQPGGQRDAILFSLSANAAHGLRRTNEDKRRAVLTMLRDQEWSTWSDREIARRCAVTHPLVISLRPKPPPDTGNGYQYQPRTFIHPKTGEPTTMKTALIGGSRDNSGASQGNGHDQERREHRQNEPDRSNAYLLHGMRAVLDAIEQMPPPSDAAASYPSWAEHGLDAARVSRAAEWLSQFAKLWAAGAPARNERTQAMIGRIREASNVAG